MKYFITARGGWNYRQYKRNESKTLIAGEKYVRPGKTVSARAVILKFGPLLLPIRH